MIALAGGSLLLLFVTHFTRTVHCTLSIYFVEGTLHIHTRCIASRIEKCMRELGSLVYVWWRMLDISVVVGGEVRAAQREGGVVLHSVVSVREYPPPRDAPQIGCILADMTGALTPYVSVSSTME